MLGHVQRKWSSTNTTEPIATEKFVMGIGRSFLGSFANALYGHPLYNLRRPARNTM